MTDINREKPVEYTQEAPEASLSPGIIRTRESMDETVNKPLSALLKEKLDGIAQVNVIETGNPNRETLRIDVTDYERWNSRETAETIVPILAPVLQQFYEDSPEHPFDMQKDVIDDPDGSDYCLCDQLFLTANNQQADGFAMLKKLGDTPKDHVPVILLQLISIEAGAHYKGSGKALCNLIRDQNPNAALVSATHTPAMVSVIRGIQARDEHVYFCGDRIDEQDDPDGDRYHRIREDAEEMYRDYLRADPDWYNNIPHYDTGDLQTVNYGSASMPWTDEHVWNSDDTSRAADVFRKLRRWVVENGHQDQAIFGMLTSIPAQSVTK
ncbi:MAG: hypothetical protein WCX61_01975 [Candidatus Peribacteraceae bacterium]|jgi:hypothetical protein